MNEALIKREIRDLGDGVTEITETWDLSHEDCPIDLISELIDDDKAFCTVVSTYLSDDPDRTIH